MNVSAVESGAAEVYVPEGEAGLRSTQVCHMVVKQLHSSARLSYAEVEALFYSIL